MIPETIKDCMYQVKLKDYECYAVDGPSNKIGMVESYLRDRARTVNGDVAWHKDHNIIVVVPNIGHKFWVAKRTAASILGKDPHDITLLSELNNGFSDHFKQVYTQKALQLGDNIIIGEKSVNNVWIVTITSIVKLSDEQIDDILIKLDEYCRRQNFYAFIYNMDRTIRIVQTNVYDSALSTMVRECLDEPSSFGLICKPSTDKRYDRYVTNEDFNSWVEKHNTDL